MDLLRRRRQVRGQHGGADPDPGHRPGLGQGRTPGCWSGRGSGRKAVTAAACCAAGICGRRRRGWPTGTLIRRPRRPATSGRLSRRLGGPRTGSPGCSAPCWPSAWSSPSCWPRSPSSQRNQAIQQRNLAIYNQTVSEALQFGNSNTPLAAQLNLAAYRLRPSQGLASLLLGHGKQLPCPVPLNSGSSAVTAVAFSPAGTRWPAAITARSGCGMSPTRPTPGHSARPWPAAADGQFGGVHPRRAHAGQRRSDGTVRCGTSPIRPTPAVRPAPGQRQASIGSVQPRWAHAGQRRQLRGGPAVGCRRPGPPPAARPAPGQRHGYGVFDSVAFSPDGHTLASGKYLARSGCGMSPTRPTRGRSASPWPRGDGGVYAVAFSPDRAHTGQRQRRRHGPAVGCRRPGPSPFARPAPGDERPTVSMRWRSAPTGTRWPAAMRRRHRPAVEYR